MTWQRWARAAIAVAVLGLAGGTAWLLMRPRAQAEAPIVQPVPPTGGATDVENDGQVVRVGPDGKIVFQLKFAQRSWYPAQNLMRFTGASGTIARGAQPIEFSAGQIDAKLKSGATPDLQLFDEMVMTKGVVFKSAPGPDALFLETTEGVYNELTGVFETAKPVKLRRGAMSGSGTGATFDRNRSVMWLLADSRVEIEFEGQGKVEVTAGRAGLAETDKYFRFEESVVMRRSSGEIRTDAAIVNLTADMKAIANMELRGRSSVTGEGGGNIPSMRADDITMVYAEDRTLASVTLMRAARLEMQGGGGRSVEANNIHMGFGGDGRTITALDATENVKVDVPAERGQPAREIKAQRLEARGSVPKGLERATFSGGTEFCERQQARPCQQALDRVGHSESLTLTLDGGFDRIKDAAFAGKFTFRDRDVSAEAPNGRYALDTKLVTLVGGKGIARVTQEDGTVDAKDIDLTLDPRRMIAKGAVKSTLRPSSRSRGVQQQKRTSIFEEDQAVSVTSASLDYDGATERAVYTGDARMWQGETVIQSNSIVLDDKSGNLEARGRVRGNFLVKDPGEQKPGAAPKHTRAEAEEMIYDEARRQITLRDKARLRGEDGDIESNRIEIFLQEDGNTLDRLEAYDSVKARLEGNRVATGARLTYTAKTRRYEMRGNPLVITEQTKEKSGGQEKIVCQKTTGATLTFDRSTDRFDVRATDGAPARIVPVPCGGSAP